MTVIWRRVPRATLTKVPIVFAPSCVIQRENQRDTVRNTNRRLSLCRPRKLICPFAQIRGAPILLCVRRRARCALRALRSPESPALSKLITSAFWLRAILAKERDSNEVTRIRRGVNRISLGRQRFCARYHASDCVFLSSCCIAPRSLVRVRYRSPHCENDYGDSHFCQIAD